MTKNKEYEEYKKKALFWMTIFLIGIALDILLYFILPISILTPLFLLMPTLMVAFGGTMVIVYMSILM